MPWLGVLNRDGSTVASGARGGTAVANHIRRAQELAAFSALWRPGDSQKDWGQLGDMLAVTGGIDRQWCCGQGRCRQHESGCVKDLWGEKCTEGKKKLVTIS